MRLVAVQGHKVSQIFLFGVEEKRALDFRDSTQCLQNLAAVS